MKKSCRVFALSLAGFLSTVSSPSLAASDWKVSGSASFETGKYGAGTRTDTFYLPLTVKRYFDRGDVSLTVPYIRQRSSAQVAPVDGGVFKIRTGAAAVETNSGLGDVLLKGTMYLMEEGRREEGRNDPFDLSIAGKIKFPTADDAKGLGTGEFDETAGLEFGKKLLKGTTLFTDIYYTFIGSPPGTSLKDRVSFDIGLSHDIDPGFSASVFYEESTALISGNSNIMTINGSLEYKVSNEARVFAGVTIGLTDTSPDYGMNAGASLRF